MIQKISVLGSTGSIGSNTLDVLARHPDRFEVFALVAATQIDLLFAQCVRHRPRIAVLADAAGASELEKRIKAAGLCIEVRSGVEAICDVAGHREVDMVMAAIVGAAGLAPCLAAARAGKRLLLANKEALVVGGSVFMAAVHSGGATLLPIDSEHSAIFQSLPDDPKTLGAANRADCAHGIRWSVPAPGRVHTPRCDAGRSLRASELGDGTQDFGGLCNDDEQGPRGH
jgi:1-deoxy-D-xylulose-5-phosphate reductoisomerase